MGVRHLGSDQHRPRAERLSQALLYLCCDRRSRQGDLPEFLDAVLRGGPDGGVDVVQLREKGLEAREEMAAAEVFAAAAVRHGALFAVNDRADVAAAVGADVLHLGQGDLPVAVARRFVADDVLVGRSTHAPGEVDEAAIEPGVDYYCVGPVWPTPTKPGRPAPGPSLLRHAAAGPTGRSVGGDTAAARPWFAIGGIDLSTLDEVLAAGASRVVVVRAITEADDPGAAAGALATRLRRRSAGA